MKKTLAALGAAAVGAVAVRDLTQTQHALKRNSPVVANLRYLLEAIGPELRQYIVTGNDDDIDLVDRLLSSRPLREVYGYGPAWGTVGPDLADEITKIMAEALATHGG